MADLTMCRGCTRKVRKNGRRLRLDLKKPVNEEENPCPVREYCHRFTARADPFAQTFFAECPYDPEKETCGFFWDNEKKGYPSIAGDPKKLRSSRDVFARRAAYGGIDDAPF